MVTRMIQDDIRQLAAYGVETGLVPKEDEVFTVNRLAGIVSAG